MRSSGPIVALAASDSGSDSGSGPVWNMLARCGEWDLSSGGRQAFTPELFAGLVKSFASKMESKRWPIGAPVGVNHALFAGLMDAEATKALGYITAMEQRDGEDGPGTELWGAIDWTDEGKRRIQGREFQGGSIEYVAGESPDFLGHSATNHPAVHGLAPMAASEGPEMDDLRIEALEAQVAALTERLAEAEARADKAEASAAEYRAKEIAAAAEALVSEGRFAATDAGRGAARVMLASMTVEQVREAIPAPVKAAVAASADAPIKTEPRAKTAEAKPVTFAELASQIPAGVLTGIGGVQ